MIKKEHSSLQVALDSQENLTGSALYEDRAEASPFVSVSLLSEGPLSDVDYDRIIDNNDESLSDDRSFSTLAPSDIQQKQQQMILKGIAHDINNNLMAILSACDQIERKTGAISDVDWAFETIRMQVKSSAVLLRDLVNNHLSETFEVLDQSSLNTYLTSILPSLSLLAGEKTKIEMGSVVTPPVRIHTLLLHRVLMQLVRNVSELNHAYPLAYISVRRVGGWCEISVSDNGPGLVDVQPEDIFKPGVTTKAKHGSRGYGLSAVAWAVQYWQGEYGVETIEGDTGCRFWVRIPLDSQS